MDAWREANRAWWDERAPLHVESAFYDVEGFRAGRSSLLPFEPDELGAVAGKDLVHLQCHFGLDSLSWARRGARVAGVDFSRPAIDAAAALAAELALDATFVLGDVHDAPALLGRRFDVVYSSVGALGWLPDIRRWARAVRDLARPGGLVYLVEAHPASDMLGNEDLTVRYPYFHTEPIHDDSPGTYAMSEGPPFTHVHTYEWIHPISEVVGALLDVGFALERLSEFPFASFLRWPFMRRDDQGLYWLPDEYPSVPLLYSLKARLG